jgi:DNA ligase-1
MKTKMLYKRTAGNKVQQWCMEIEGPKYRTISGQTDGEQTTSNWTQAKAKNSGRANETSAVEQAVAEVKSCFAKKVKAGYSETVEAAETDTRFKVMLAWEYKEHRDSHIAPRFEDGELVFSQPKLDGVRCVAKRNGLWSRNNTQIISCPHIEAALKPFFEEFPEAILDGELYNHELRHDFDSLISILRKTSGLTDDDLVLSAKMAQYQIYDAAGTWGSDSVAALSFPERTARVLDIVAFLDVPFIVAVPTVACFGMDKLDFFYELYLEEGYEGQMVRTAAPYRIGARSKDLLKRKEKEDHEYEVVDIVEGVGNRSGVAGFAVLKLPDGRTFNSNLKGGMAHYRMLLQNKQKFIGGQATVTFTNLTPKGVPRFPRIAKDKWWPQGRDL